MEHLPDWFPMAGGIALVALGLLAGAWAIVGDLRRAVVARDWPGVDGLVTQSVVEAHGSGDERSEKHVLCYRYEVQGVEYVGKRIKAGGELDLTIFGSANHTWSTAQLRQTRYRPGRGVYVLYNPVNPKDCCLEPGGMGNALAEVIVSIALAVGGVYLIVTQG
jgi:hypothetical protein